LGKALENDRLNRWLTLGANIGVLTGILLLVFELNQNREMTIAQTRSEISQGELVLLTSIAGDRDLADILIRVLEGEEISASESLRHMTHSESVFRLWQNVHYQGRKGLYEEEEFLKHIDTMRWVLDISGYLIPYWCQARANYPEEFASEIDQLIPSDSCLD
jgi:hypothetical protein